MAKRRKDEWSIEEWDESLDHTADSSKDTFAPVNTENRGTDDEWDSPVQKRAPQKQTWKWIAAIGSIAAILVLILVLAKGSRNDNRTLTIVPSVQATAEGLNEPPVSDVPVTEPVITASPATEIPVTELPATEAPVTDQPATEPPTAGPDEIVCAWYGEEMRYYYRQLSQKEKDCFKLLYNGAMDFRKDISIRSIQCSETELDRVMYALTNDSPELFQISGSCSYATNRSGTVVSVNLDYRLDSDQYGKRCLEIGEILDGISVSVSDLTDEYAVEKVVYSWIIMHCEYLIEEDSTAFADSVLCEGKAQCSGYSKALSLLLRSLGIQCIEVCSVPEEKHQWNMTRIGGEWYQCDCTWDDQEEALAGAGQNEHFSFLNVPDRLMTKHTQDQDGFSRPECNSITANYAYREGIYIASYDEDSDPTVRINAEIQRTWFEGRRRFLVMLDGDFTEAETESICKQIRLPGTAGCTFFRDEETRTVYILSGTETKIHFIDVGQGDAILVQCGGENLLIDAGPAEAGATVNSYLKETLGTETLNYVIATHEHDDHIGGMPDALKGLGADLIWSSPAIPMNWWLDKVLPRMKQQDIRIEKPTPFTTFMVGGSIVTFINTTREAANPNDLSLAVRIDFGTSSAILTADIETDAEMNILEKRIPLKAQLLKVAHHGGNTSSSEAFIRAVSPETAVISVGKGNKHGHPHVEPLRCLGKYGVTVYRTDEYGSIICTSGEKGWNVEVRKTR